jgi:arylsulfatase A-like enzyme
MPSSYYRNVMHCRILIALIFVFAALCAEARNSPNVVFILADDLGYGDLSCYGAPDIRTPNLDKLARDGVRFTQFYANGPVCTPTRCAFMTGRYQQRVGGLEWAIPPGGAVLGLPPQEKTIARVLRDASYTTALCGKWHLGYTIDRAPNHHGFDHFFGLLSGNHNFFTHRESNGDADLYSNEKPIEMKGYSTDLITQHALKFLQSAASAGVPNSPKPFFLYLAYNAPHWPIQGPDDEHIEITRTNWTRGTRETYVKMVEAMDEGIGQVLAFLDKAGLAENTLIVFTSDNGGDKLSRNEPLAKQKGTLWEGGIRVPCIARFPGKIPAGSETKQVAITMDWSATILGLAGAKPPKDRPLDGVDLLPILSGKQQKERTLFWRRKDVKFVQTHRAVRDGNWKCIEDQKTGETFLYDLANDVSESMNLAAEKAKITERLKKKLDRWEEDIDPPLYSASPAQLQ